MVTLKNFFSFKNNRFFWLNIIAMIIVIVVAVFGTLWGLDLYTHHGESYVVPNVKNKNLDQAQLLLNQQFMQGIVIDSNYVKELPAGIVLDQAPAGGLRVKKGRTIYLTIKMYLTEEEWHTYQSALVDYYLHASEGARLYLKKYVEPGVQPTATAYYAASDAVRTIMKADPNVVSRAAVAAQDSMRPAIDGILNQFITEQTTIQSQAGLIAGGRSQFNGDVQSDYRNNEQNRADTETEDTYEEEDVLVNFDESKPEETTAAPRETEAPTPVETEAETTAPETTAEETMAPTETTGVAETENLEEPVG